jgi:hypothetical protein
MIESKNLEKITAGNGNGRTADSKIEIEENSVNRAKTNLPNGISFDRFTNRGIAVRLFLTCWLVFALHFATNTVREIYPALSLAENFSFDVSEYAGIHPDIFTLDGGGTFINNNPGASVMGAVPYFLSRPVSDRIIERARKSRAADPPTENANYDTIYPMARDFYRQARAKGFDIKFGLAAGITQAFLMAPLSALSAVVMFFILLSLTEKRGVSVLFALLYAFATPVFYRTAQLNQNLLVAHFALFAFALLWRFSKKRDAGKKPFYFLAGLFAGWTVVLDYSGLAAVAALSGYAFSRWVSFEKREIRDLAKFGVGVSISAVILMAYQWSSFGNPILPAQSYMPPANFTEMGYRGFAFPSFELLMQTAFSIRYGLFVSAPILLLALVFPVWIGSRSGFLERRELVFVLAFIGLFSIFCSANQYGWMQFNTGVRHIVPVVPFVFLLAANVLLKMPKNAAAAAGLFAVYWSWCLAMYRDVEQGLGVLEAIKHVTLEGFRLPWLTTLERMGFVENASVIPLFLLCGAMIWILWNVGGRRGDLSF